jgi:hypothetical protein
LCTPRRAIGQTESGCIVLAVICWAASAQRRCYPTGRCTFRPFSHLLIVDKLLSLSLFHTRTHTHTQVLLSLHVIRSCSESTRVHRLPFNSPLSFPPPSSASIVWSPDSSFSPCHHHHPPPLDCHVYVCMHGCSPNGFVISKCAKYRPEINPFLQTYCWVRR